MPRARTARLLGALLIAGLGAGSPVETLTIVTSPRVDAFQRTVQAVKAVADAAGISPRVVETNSGAGEVCALALEGAPLMILSVGTEAARVSDACGGSLLRVAALTVGPGPLRRIAPLDVPPADVMSAARRWFPDKTRIGIILNPTSALYTAAEIEVSARKAGLHPTVAECSRAGGLLDAFDRLERDSDLIWCLPDTQIYMGATIKQLVLASLSNKIPLIGFSENFLRAGAAMAIYPDFDRVAAHSAECVRLLLEGKPAPAAPPDYFSTGLNRRVLRLMNLPFRVDERGDSLVLIN